MIIEGWVSGFNKLAFAQMLRDELGYSLNTAKSTTDEVLTRRRVELIVPKSDLERILRLSKELGAIVTDRATTAEGSES